MRPFAHDGSRHLPRERITRYVADAHGRDARNPGGVPKPENHRRHNPFDMRSTHPPPPLPITPQRKKSEYTCSSRR